MKIIVKIGRGKVDHAAQYQPETGEIILYCKALKYLYYYAAISDQTTPNKENVTCKKCLKKVVGES